LENRTKTYIGALAQGLDCGISTNKKNNDTPQHKDERWHNHRYTKKREEESNTKAHKLFNDASREVNDVAT